MFNQRRTNIIISLFLLTIITMISLIVYVSIDPSTTKETKVYKVGTSPDYPPLEYKENGKLKGFDIDLIKEIAKKANIKIKIVETSFDNLITSIQNNKIDIIASGFSKSSEREKVVNFSNNYISTGNVIITNKKTNFGNDISSFKNKKVAILTGTTQEEYVKKNKFKNIKNFDNAQIALKALELGNVDMVYTGELNGRNIAKKFKNLNVNNDSKSLKEDMSLAIIKNDKKLKTKINESLKDLKNEKLLSSLSKKWFGKDFYKN